MFIKLPKSLRVVNRQNKNTVEIEVDGNPAIIASETFRRKPLPAIQKDLSDKSFLIDNGVVLDYGPASKSMETREYQEVLDTIGGTVNAKTKDLLVSWDTTRINVLNRVGTEFDLDVGFRWSPIRRGFIDSHTQITRLVCANGMITKTRHASFKIPLVDEWEANLNVAAERVQSIVESTLRSRVEAMVDARASAATAMLLRDHAKVRRLHTGLTADEAKRLTQIVDLCQKVVDHYGMDILTTREQAARLPSHITQFDAMNISTEMLTHFPEVEKSTNNALQMIANRLLFTKKESLGLAKSRNTPVPLDASSNPNAAFQAALN